MRPAMDNRQANCSVFKRLLGALFLLALFGTVVGALAVAQRDRTAGLLATLKPKADFGHVVLSPDGKILAHDDKDKVVLWELSNPREPKRCAVLEGHTEWVDGIHFSPDGKVLAAIGYHKLVKLWDVAA